MGSKRWNDILAGPSNADEEEVEEKRGKKVGRGIQIPVSSNNLVQNKAEYILYKKGKINGSIWNKVEKGLKLESLVLWIQL